MADLQFNRGKPARLRQDGESVADYRIAMGWDKVATPEVQGAPAVGAEISIRIGQHMRHRDFKGQRVTGIVEGLGLDSEGALKADLVLDAPLIFPAVNEHDRELRLHRQTVPVTELSPFDDRDELIAEMLQELHFARSSLEVANKTIEFSGLLAQLDAIIAKALGVVNG